jgi:hypothetical protein
MEIELALDLLEIIASDQDKIYKINKQISAVDGGDFAPQITLMTCNIETAVVKLLDAILEPEATQYGIAGYFLYECGRNGSIEYQGKTYPIRNMKDVRKYVKDLHKK